MEQRKCKHGFREVFIVPHAHLDLTWLGPPVMCERRNNVIIAAALDLLESDAKYRYSIECVRPLERFLKSFPDQKQKIEELYKAGRLEVGGQYVDVAADYCDGESLVRNFYYGQRWLVETFGEATRIAREEDVLAHPAQMPQILMQSGILYLKFSRGPNGVFRWRAPDGAEVVTALFEYNHGYHFKLGETLELTVNNMPEYLAWVWSKIVPRLPELLIMDGDDGTMPNAALSPIVDQWNIDNEKTKLKLATVTEYLDSIDKTQLELKSGDMPGFWGAVLMFEQEAAAKLKRAERLLMAAEKCNAISNILKNDRPHDFQDAWRLLLAAQDHNWGGKYPEYEPEKADADKVLMLDTVIETSTNSIQESMKIISRNIKIDHSGLPVIILNTLSWARDDIISIPNIDDEYEYFIQDDAGCEISIQKEKNDRQEGSIKFIAYGIPPLGIKTYFLMKREKETSNFVPGEKSDQTIENEFYHLTADPYTGGLSRIFDKETGVEIYKKKIGFGVPLPGFFAVAARFTVPPQSFYENPANLKKGAAGESVKYLGKFWTPGRFRVDTLQTHCGPVMDRMVINGKFIDSPVEYDMRLFHGIKRVDIRVAIDWCGTPGIFLGLVFPIPLRNKEVRIGTPYFAHRMGEEAEGFWKFPGMKIHPKMRGVQDWFSVSNARKTITLSTSWHQWDFSIYPAALLLASDNRGGFFTGERYLQKGRHEWLFSLTSAAGDWTNAHSYRTGVEPVNPCIVHCEHEEITNQGAALSEMSFSKVEPENIILTAFKNSEDRGGSIFLRFYEVLGQDTKATFTFPFEVKRAVRTDVLERETEELDARGHAVSCPLRAYEIGGMKIYL